MSRLAALLALSLVVSASAAADPRTGATLGARGGYAFHSGRSVVVGGVSGASTREDVDVFTRSSFVGGLVLDAGVAAGPGSVGARLFVDGATGPFWAVGLVPRYRWQLGRFAPWVGAGLGLELDEGGDAFWSVPVAGGCDLDVGGGWAVTAELTAVMMNPWGPSRVEMTDDGARELEDHLNRLTLQLGVAYRLF